MVAGQQDVRNLDTAPIGRLRILAVLQQGVLSRGPLRRAALEHGGGGQAVGSDGGHLHLGISGQNRLDELLPDPAALAVNH